MMMEKEDIHNKCVRRFRLMSIPSMHQTEINRCRSLVFILSTLAHIIDALSHYAERNLRNKSDLTSGLVMYR